MPLPVDVQSLSAGVVLEQFKVACQELGILQVSDAPSAELRSAQRQVDIYEQEISRRMSW